MKVTVDRDRCAGHGECIAISPKVFELDEEGKAAVILPDPPEELWRNLRGAAVLCPTAAIRITDIEA